MNLEKDGRGFVYARFDRPSLYKNMNYKSFILKDGAITSFLLHATHLSGPCPGNLRRSWLPFKAAADILSEGS